MRKLKEIAIPLLALLFFCASAFSSITFAAFADPYGGEVKDNGGETIASEAKEYKGYDYLLDSYHIDVTVNENNTFNINERIVAYFNVPKHGIYRTITLKNRVERLDGTASNNRVKLKDLKVEGRYSSYIENGAKVIKIGDEDRLVVGPQNYSISYLYDIGKDPVKDYDEFYFNLIGEEWDTAVGGITFNITMPKEFGAEDVGFSSGAVGSQENGGIEYQVEGNVISGKYNGILNPGEALTVRVELPEGYFVKAASNFDLLLLLSFILPILFVLIALFLWLRIGRDKRVVETVEFYPPEGFNSAEIGFIYKGNAENIDVISLLIYLANKGYIKISETLGEGLSGSPTSFKLIKLKDYDGDDENEKLFLKNLFRMPKESLIEDIAGFIKAIKNIKKTKNVDMDELYENRNEVSSEDLKNNFYLTMNMILANLNKKEKKQELFEKNSLGKGFIAALMIVCIYLLITIKPVLEYGDASGLPFALIFPGIGFTVLFIMVFGNTKLPLKIFGLIWGLGFGGVPWAVMVLPSLLIDPMYLLAYILGLVWVLIIVIMFKLMPKRTDYGNEMLGKIRGFRRFLENAEKPKLESLVLEDPTYFYSILPFTYVLGVSDKWIKMFEVIALAPPEWYDSKATFNMVNFSSFMGSTMKTASTSMSSSPSGSGSSGGGSSGGGSGGGGGGSW